MDWFPLINSVRIAGIASVFTFLIGIFLAWEIAKLPRIAKGILDCLLTLPLVLPPTVVGFFLLKCISPKSMLGAWMFSVFHTKLVMTWHAAVFAAILVTFPLMYRTARGAFEAFDRNQIYAAQTLGIPNRVLFWKIVLPGCRQGILAGFVLSFARGLGEYGATSMVSGYTPGRTATIATTVYQLWREGNDAAAYRWVLVNLCISLLVLLSVNLLERRQKGAANRHVGAFH